jgi:hypothetical protein
MNADKTDLLPALDSIPLSLKNKKFWSMHTNGVQQCAGTLTSVLLNKKF